MIFCGAHVFPQGDVVPTRRRYCGARRRTYVVMLTALVQFFATDGNGIAQEVAEKNEASRKQEAVVRVENSKLPALVLEMRDAIVGAVASGDISEMRTAIEWNELRPELGIGRDDDPIEVWKRVSHDGKGLQILAILGEILEGPAAKLPLGRDIENNDVFVWPYLAELDGRKLTNTQMIELYKLAPVDVAQRFVETGKWRWYRLAIGADGTWHIFSKISNTSNKLDNKPE